MGFKAIVDNQVARTEIVLETSPAATSRFGGKLEQCPESEMGSAKTAVILSERTPGVFFSLGVVSRRICGCSSMNL
jgi:hypothetical protein